jgi:hypothetical protein
MVKNMKSEVSFLGGMMDVMSGGESVGEREGRRRKRGGW